jgi:hypothetical protein
MKTPRDDDGSQRVERRGPTCYENWKAALAGTLAGDAYEVPLYTDARITGMITEGYGPYRLINVRTPPRRGLAHAAILLRAEAQIVFDSEDLLADVDDLRRLPAEKRSERWHGGGLDDEIAALFSLSLGIRLKAGDRSREFAADGDPKGVPCPAFRAEPLLLTSGHRMLIPDAPRQQSLNDDALVKHLHVMTTDDAVSVVRAARLYQDALWIAESQPALSWLMLVSAVEGAAGHQCERHGLPRQGKKTAKFVDFVCDFLPDPPRARPREWGQCPWDKPAMGRTMATIYDHRCAALHDGIPFPAPMCEPPFKSDEMAVPVERPCGAAYPGLGVQWHDDEVPMCIHIFEYIVRGALCKWWESMIPKGDTVEGGCRA